MKTESDYYNDSYQFIMKTKKKIKILNNIKIVHSLY